MTIETLLFIMLIIQVLMFFVLFKTNKSLLDIKSMLKKIGGKL